MEQKYVKAPTIDTESAGHNNSQRYKINSDIIVPEKERVFDAPSI